MQYQNSQLKSPDRYNQSENLHSSVQYSHRQAMTLLCHLWLPLAMDPCLVIQLKSTLILTC